MQQGNTTHIIRSMNLQLIYKYIRIHGPVTKQDIQKNLNMSLPTITQNLKFLDEQNLLKTTKEINGTGGRNAIQYSSNPDGRCSIGMYLTGKHIHLVVIDLTGGIMYTDYIRRPFNPKDDDYLKAVGAAVDKAVESLALPREKILGVAIAVQSLISEDGETVEFGFTHNFTGVTKSEISKYISLPTHLLHDSFVAGYGEVWNRTNVETAVYLALNDSVGGSIVLDNQIYSGLNHRAGEVGHMKFNPDNHKLCNCGKTGCFDTECSTLILQNYAQNTLATFFEILESGDPGAAEVWDEYLSNLARAVDNLHVFFDCPVIIGGALGAFIDPYMKTLQEKVGAYDPFDTNAANYCIPCIYKKEATAAGAAITIMSRFFHDVTTQK